MGFSQGLKDEFETAVVNEPSVFEPLKFYCNKLEVRVRNRAVRDKTYMYMNLLSI